ncbi:hypothetical protein P4O66_019507, partial [Electrophorus voltai]
MKAADGLSKPACKQRDDEPVADFLVRLTRVHTDHCGIDAPAQRAVGPGEVGAWEAHLRNSFLMNMRKDISDLIRKNCIGYSRAPLSTIEEHAKHHETILGKKDAKRERQRADTTHQAMLTMLRTQVKAVLPEVTDKPLHTHQPGDWVLIKDFRRKRWSQPRWRGPFQVLLTTQNRMALDMLLAKEGGVCSMMGDHCCTYIPPSDAPGGNISMALDHM